MKLGKTFILDDATPFGIELPQEVISNLDAIVLDAEELAKEIEDYIPENAIYIGQGGLIVATLVGTISEYLDAQRVYQKDGNRQIITVKFGQRPEKNAACIIDDIIASGKTIYEAAKYLGLERPKAASLVLSGQLRGGCREKTGSTVKGIEGLVTVLPVDRRDGFPAIFSGRMVLYKTKIDQSYMDYLSKYVKDREKFAEAIFSVNTEPYELLYKKPKEFFEKYRRG